MHSSDFTFTKFDQTIKQGVLLRDYIVCSELLLDVFDGIFYWDLAEKVKTALVIF